jgi:DNA-binding GntR family transcriptional regulator/predicted metal-dependent enzyme (double-stranded beta helix superfamily)
MAQVAKMLRAEVKPVRQTLNRVAFDRIKRDIIMCALQPGSQITEAQLAGRYALGKAPIRAALLGLSQEGFVRAIPRRGYVITPITIRDVQDIFQLRILLEPTAARLSAGRVPTELLRRLAELCNVRAKPGEMAVEPAVGAHRELHLIIARASGNQRLADTLAKLYDDVERLIHLGVSRISPEEMSGYRPLVSALAAGDGELAARLMVEQIELGRKRILEALLSTAHQGEIDIRQGVPTESKSVQRFAEQVSSLIAESSPADLPFRVAESLAALLRNPQLLDPEQLESSPHSYRRHSLHADPEGRFSIEAVVWEAGQGTPVHDQTCWTVIGVYQGELREVCYRHLDGVAGPPRVVPTGVTHYHKGDVTYPAPADLHRWDNPAENVSVSIQIYGAVVGTSGNNFGRCYLPEQLA